MKRGWCLGEAFARPAGEALADMLDYLPAAGDHFERLCDVFANLDQSV
jgi:hypothetical protein